MSPLLGANLPKILNEVLGPNSPDVTLIVVTSGTRTPGDPTDGTNPTEVNKTAKGYPEDYEAFQVDGTLVQRTDSKIVLFADSIEDGAVPKPSDKIIFKGVTYAVIDVKPGSAEATHVCQVRGTE